MTSIYEFAKMMQDMFEDEADDLAVRNGETPIEDGKVATHNLLTGQVKGLRRAAQLVSEAISKLHGEPSNAVDEEEEDDG